MKTIKVFWWRYVDNFGDALNPYLVEKLSGLKVVHFSMMSKYGALKNILKSTVLMRKPHPEAFTTFKSFGEKLLVIGSVMSYSNAKTTVWGAGFMNENESCSGGKFLAVRGKETVRRLNELGFRCNPALGDPALLLPLLYSPIRVEKHVIGIIPHWTEVENFKVKYGTKFKIIDLVTKDIEGVVDQILSCKFILSSSLHGVIVGHAYSIPSLWIKEGYIHTDGFKFKDYFSSVGIENYDGLNLDELLLSFPNLEDVFESLREKTLINISLSDIQTNLLNVAPFTLKSDLKVSILGG